MDDGVVVERQTVGEVVGAAALGTLVLVVLQHDRDVDVGVGIRVAACIGATQEDLPQARTVDLLQARLKLIENRLDIGLPAALALRYGGLPALPSQVCSLGVRLP